MQKEMTTANKGVVSLGLQCKSERVAGYLWTSEGGQTPHACRTLQEAGHPAGHGGIISDPCGTCRMHLQLHMLSVSPSPRPVSSHRTLLNLQDSDLPNFSIILHGHLLNCSLQKLHFFCSLWPMQSDGIKPDNVLSGRGHCHLTSCPFALSGQLLLGFDYTIIHLPLQCHIPPGCATQESNTYDPRVRAP